MNAKLFLISFLLSGVTSIRAQIYETNAVVETLAGSGFTGLVDGYGTKTMFNYPSGVACDKFGNILVADRLNRVVRKITTNGQVTNLSPYYIGLSHPESVCVASDSTIFVGDSYSVKFLNDKHSDTAGPKLGPDFGERTYVAFHPSGVIIVVDTENRKILKIETVGALKFRISDFVGSGNNGIVDGNGIFCSFKNPSAITVDANGAAYVCDENCIRKIDLNLDVTTIAGNKELSGYRDGQNNQCLFNGPTGIAVDGQGNVFVADTFNNVIRKISPSGEVSTVAGSIHSGFSDGQGVDAKFYHPFGMCFDLSGSLIVADLLNARIRRISFRKNGETTPALPTLSEPSLFYGAKIIGSIGHTYRLESAMGTADSWQFIKTIQLTNSPQLWIDENPIQGRKFYRAVLLP